MKKQRELNGRSDVEITPLSGKMRSGQLSAAVGLGPRLQYPSEPFDSSPAPSLPASEDPIMTSCLSSDRLADKFTP